MHTVKTSSCRIATLVGISLLGAATSAVGQTSSDNDAVVDQAGTDNAAQIEQIGALNRSGSEARPIFQDGIFNNIGILQEGTGNRIGLSDPGLSQLGRQNTVTTFNQMTITQTSDDNTVGAVTQVSEGSVANGANTLSITQGGSGSQTVDRVRQTQQDGKAAQFTTIEQTGAFNRVALIDQLANSNAYDADNQITLRMTGVRNGQIGLSGAAAETIVTDNGIVQEAGNGDIRSNGNRVDLLITGDFNRFGIRQGGRMNDVGFITINGNENQLGLRQDGTENDIVIAAPIEGAFNIIGIDQLGTNAAILSLDTASAGDGGAQSDRNSVFIHQDGTNSVTFDLKGDDNDFRIDQDYDNVGRGGNNVAALSVFGNGNIGLVRQYGDNLATIKISGDNNLTASATAILPVASVGEFVQDGKGNEASVFVFGDTNIMGTFQSGDDHRLFMTIIGSGNQAAISQSGAANIGNLVQNGKGNAASILQR